MKTIVFRGPLQAQYPNGIEVAGKSAFECISLLENFPGFDLESPQIKVTLPKFPTRDSLVQLTDEPVIELVQILDDDETFSGSGAKAGAYIQIVVGVILIVASFWMGGLTAQQGFLMLMAGAAQVLGGVLALMMKQPTAQGSSNDPKSNYLAANKNTVKIGTPIGILIGKRKVYGHLISFNVTATDTGNPPSAINTGSGYSSGGGRIGYNGQWVQHD